MTRSLLALVVGALLAASAASILAARPATGSAPSTPVVPLQESAPVMFRVNQVGYAQNLPKRALAMTRRVPTSRRYAVLDRRGKVVEGGTATGPARWNAHYLVYTLDFGHVTAPGLYTLRFAAHRSPPLRVAVASTLYRPLADAALAFLQSQRDGPETIPGAMHRRPSHLGDGFASVYRMPNYRGTKLLGGLVATGERVDVSGGWFDAGDYLKLVETASFTDVALLYGAREFPTAFSDPAALLAEARHGIDWLLKMWDQNRRVLYFQVGIGDGNGGSILGDHDLWRLPQADDGSRAKPGSSTWFAVHRPVFAANAPGAPISPNLAGRVAAAFGLCAQVFAAADPAYAARCLLAGQTIYDQASTHPGATLLTSVPHAYYTEPEWRDDMALGAAELYLATQQLASSPALRVQASLPHTDLGYYLARAGQWINAYIEGAQSGQDSLNLYDVSTLAGHDVAEILRTSLGQGLEKTNLVPTDPSSLLRDRADQLQLAEGLARREPFGLANTSTNLDTVAHALGYAVEAHTYDALAGTRVFEPFAQSQLGWVLGANAWGTSFVVGAGSVFPHCLASQIPNLSGSLNGHGTILAGATVNGPTAPANLRELDEPEGARRCPAHSALSSFDAQTGHGLVYLDDVRSPATSEPTDDLAALTLLAAAQSESAG
ncbi:MAG TPA: glycoside hydrolase family 9 protein [Solirubrobacteraceae bacterium]|jgi:endoglucanase|nr:glycoside hydrolase family 9 protein [Solirubrobacteraceae bacterium]